MFSKRKKKGKQEVMHSQVCCTAKAMIDFLLTAIISLHAHSCIIFGEFISPLYGILPGSLCLCIPWITFKVILVHLNELILLQTLLFINLGLSRFSHCFVM